MVESKPNVVTDIDESIINLTDYSSKCTCADGILQQQAQI